MPGLEERLGAYVELVQNENERFGLVKFSDPRELIIKHLLDSLAPAGLFGGFIEESSPLSWIDLGSGAGLPGIPLALLFPGVTVTLAERKGKRALFLELAKSTLGLSNVRLWPKPFEELKERFSVVTFRAFSPLDPSLIKLVRRVLLPGGRIVAYKGRKAVLDAEVAKISSLAAECSVVPLQVPFLDEERHAVVLRFE
ncbi:MAG: 16S rRNA (guanine(527)-N(7))-methyltransferase RsmG [Spirochaetales bacterium]|nr:16S rRNA (guanine(527)-N(7))-methyltransferase RsmG [Spirochaetales bacterium]